MSRKKKNYRNILIKPDIKYNSLLVSRLINGLMVSGKKDRSRKYIYMVLQLIRIKYLVNPIFILLEVFNKVKPIVGLRYKKVGGSGYNIPFKISNYRSIGIVIRWIKQILLDKKKGSIVELLFKELINAFNGYGLLILKKNLLYRDVLYNRAFFYL